MRQLWGTYRSLSNSYLRRLSSGRAATRSREVGVSGKYAITSRPHINPTALTPTGHAVGFRISDPTPTRRRMHLSRFLYRDQRKSKVCKGLRFHINTSFSFLLPNGNRLIRIKLTVFKPRSSSSRCQTLGYEIYSGNRRGRRRMNATRKLR